MKKTCVSVIMLSLTAQGLLASRTIGGWEYFEAERRFPEEKVKHLRAEFKDAEKLKRYLGMFFAETWLPDDVPPLFMRKFDVSGEALRNALMGIIRECSEKVQWKNGQAGEPDDITWARDALINAIRWLGTCADTEAKNILMRITTDDTKDNRFRVAAIGGYLRCADAQEARDALVRFLINMRVNPYSIYLIAMSVYDGADRDMGKREAIAASLTIALAHEKSKDVFAEMDKKLAERSKDYAASAQRLAMLRRMSRLPPSTFRDTDPDLKAALKSFRFRLTKTNVSTNLTELMARDFGKPKGD